MNQPEIHYGEVFSYIQVKDAGPHIELTVALSRGGVTTFISKKSSAADIILAFRKLAARLEKETIKRDISNN